MQLRTTCICCLRVRQVPVASLVQKVGAWLQWLLSSESKIEIGRKFPPTQAQVSPFFRLLVESVDCPAKNRGKVLIYTLTKLSLNRLIGWNANLISWQIHQNTTFIFIVFVDVSATAVAFVKTTVHQVSLWQTVSNQHSSGQPCISNGGRHLHGIPRTCLLYTSPSPRD